MMKPKKYSFVRVMLRLLPLQFKSSPLLAITIILLAVASGLLTTAAVMTTQRLFDAVSQIATGQFDWRHGIPPLLVFASVVFGEQVITSIGNFLFWGVHHMIAAGDMRNIAQQQVAAR